MNSDDLHRAAAHVAKRWPKAKPVCGLICGSGWGEVVGAFRERDAMDYAQIPGLGQPGVEGHSGRLVWASAAGLETFIFQGRRHWYEGEGWTPIALPIYVMKKRRVRVVVLTNAAGGIRRDLRPGDLMVLDDHINMMGANPLAGPHNPVWGPRFPDQSTVYDPELRRLADRAARKVRLRVAHGVYLASPGPTYETPAEIRAYRILGADAVGMSTVPEAILAHAAGLRVLGLSCITNLAAGIARAPLSHEEVTATTRAVMHKMKALFAELWKEIAHAYH